LTRTGDGDPQRAFGHCERLITVCRILALAVLVRPPPVRTDPRSRGAPVGSGAALRGCRRHRHVRRPRARGDNRQAQQKITQNARTGKEQRTGSMFPLPLAGVEAEIFPEPRARREDGAQVGNRRQQAGHRSGGSSSIEVTENGARDDDSPRDLAFGPMGRPPNRLWVGL